MAETPKPDAKLTDQERHARFKEMALEVEASVEEADFERAFADVTKLPQER